MGHPAGVKLDRLKLERRRMRAARLLQQGVSETQLSSQLYTELLNATLQNDQQLSSAIGNLAGSLVPRQTVINTGSTTSTAA